MDETTLPWLDAAAYGLQLRLMRAQGGRTWLVAHGNTSEHEAALRAIGLQAHPTANYWFRAYAPGEAFRPPEVLAALPMCVPRSLPRSQVVIDVPPVVPAAQARSAVGPAPSGPTVPAVPRRVAAHAQSTEFGRAFARLLGQAGVAGAPLPAAQSDVRVFRRGGAALRVTRRAAEEAADRWVRVDRLSESMLVWSVRARLDGRGEWVLSGCSAFDSSNGYSDNAGAVEGLLRVREAVSEALADRTPESLESLDLDSDAAVGRSMTLASETAVAKAFVVGSHVRDGSLRLDVQVEDAWGRPRLRLFDLDASAGLQSVWESLPQRLPSAHVAFAGRWVLGATEPTAPPARSPRPARTGGLDLPALAVVSPAPRMPPQGVDTGGVPATKEQHDERERATGGSVGPVDSDAGVDGGAGGDAGRRDRPGGVDGERRSADGADDGLPVEGGSVAVSGGDAGGEVAAPGDSDVSGTGGMVVEDPRPGEGAGAGERTPQPRGGAGQRRGRRHREVASARGDFVVPGATRERWNAVQVCEDNLAALRALARIESADASGVLPDAEDLEAVTKYAGWGGLPGVFARAHTLARYAEPLRALLGDDGFAAARAGALNAHYTAVPVIDVVWSTLQHLGVEGGVGLEPGAGSGLFLGRVPEALRATTEFVAVEKDPTSARILRALYPGAEVHACGYEETSLFDGSMDFVVGNVPFGNYQVYDPRYRTLKAPIHDYFIVKSLDKLAAGGVMAVITSTGTLDKLSSRVREAMYERADLLGAFRMPGDTFRDNAGTEVTTDLLVFRKRLPGEAAQPFDWQGLATVTAADGSSVSVNRVFTSTRGRVFGWHVTSTRMYGSEQATATAIHPQSRERAPGVAEWPAIIQSVLPAGVHSPASVDADAGIVVQQVRDIEGLREGSYQRIDGVLGVIQGHAFEPLRGLKKIDTQRLGLFIDLRDALVATLRAQQQGCSDAALKELQAPLNAAYDAFVKAVGPVSLPANRRAFADDPDAMLVLACEKYDRETKTAVKAEVFEERTLGASDAQISVESPKDALAVCINEVGRVIPSRIAALSGESWEACRDALRGAIYLDPESGVWEIAPLYLSGHIPRKLEVARRAAETDPAFAENVSALEARMPRRVVAEEIDVSLGSPWIPASVIEDFACEVLSEGRRVAQVQANPHTASWTVEASKMAASPHWSTSRLTAWRLLEMSLNGNIARVTDKDDDGREVLNAVATAQAQEKQRRMQEAFERWVWTAPSRRETLEEVYNAKFNGYRSADYSAVAMDVPGLAIGRAFRPHQTKAIVRGVLERNLLLAHPVGFGKTATMAGLAMKLRALGLANKVAIVTPKNVIYQFAAEITRFFPTARVLVVRSQDLSRSGRALFWRRAQLSNPDVVLVTPEAWKRLRLPREAELAYLTEEKDRLAAALQHEEAAVETSTVRTREVKRIERLKLALESRIQTLIGAQKDEDRITLEDLGVDALFVDEAHNYKNLQVTTRERVLGVPTAASQRASDMHAKVRYIQRLGGRVVFATGSAITNSLVEAYTLQRYLMPDELEALDIAPFDAWKAQFAKTMASLEPDPGGRGYRTVTRLAELRNVPELVALLGQVTDAVEDKSEVVGGRPDPVFISHACEPTALQSMFRDALSERVRWMRENPKEALEAGDNILVVLGDARRGALDLRAQYPGLPATAPTGNKLAEVADVVSAIAERSADIRGTQAIFLDFATPKKGASAATDWNAYETLASMLVERGALTREQIAFVHDANTDEAKAALFARVRTGDIRVILGSTQKMGEGTNFQERMVALHHLNAPFHPGHITQRNGRAIRQGNINASVEIHTFVTRGLLEDWNWHLVVLKQGFIQQVLDGLASHRDGEGLARRIVEDGESMNFAEIEAYASDNPLVKEKARVDAQVQKLEMLERGHAQDQGALRSELSGIQALMEYNQRGVERYRHARAVIEQWAASNAPAERLAEARTAAEARIDAKVATLVAAAGLVGEEAARKGAAEKRKQLGEIEEETFVAVVQGQAHLGRKAVGEALLLAIATLERMPYSNRGPVAEFAGVELMFRSNAVGSGPMLSVRADGRDTGVQIEVGRDAVGMARRLENALDAIPRELAEMEARLQRSAAREDALRQRLGAPFPMADELAAARGEQSRVNLALAELNAGAPAAADQGARQELASALRLAGLQDDLDGIRLARLGEDLDDASEEVGDELDDSDGDEEEASAGLAAG